MDFLLFKDCLFMVPMENLSSSEVVDSVLDSGSKAQNVKEKIAKGDSVAGRAEGNSATASMGSGNKDGEIDSLRSQIKEIKSGHMIEIRRLNLSKQAEIENIKAQFKELSSRQKEVFMRQKAKLENAISQIEKLSLRNKELEKELEAERKRGLAPETNVSEATSDFSNPLMDVELLRKENSSLKEKLDQVSLKENLKSKMRVAIKSPSNPPLVGEALRLEIEGISLPEIQWYRSFFGSRGFYKIPGAESREYTTTADDYGSVLKAVVLSPEEIEVESEVGPVEIRKSMIEKISDYISSKKPIEFSIKTPASLKDDQAIQVNKDKVKLRKDKSTYSKREYSSTLAVIVFIEISIFVY